MNSKEFLSQCPDVIYMAEEARADGKFEKASELISSSLLHRNELDKLPNFTDSELSDLMRAWRIDVVANTSAAKRELSGKKAVRHLQNARDVITTYYPAVEGRVSQIKQDNEGHPYDFEVEMLRDRARYCLAAAAITGNASFRQSAISFFDQAILLAEDHDLAKMEAGITKNEYEDIADSYFKARADKSEFLNNSDRARWMSRTMLGESLKLNRMKILDGVVAFGDLVQIRKNPIKIAQDVAIGVVRSNNFLQAPANWIRRKTLPKGFNSEGLKIS